MEACQDRHHFSDQSPSYYSYCVRVDEHTIHRDGQGREWRALPAGPVALGRPSHSERYGRLAIEAIEGQDACWTVTVTDACVPGVVFVCVPDLTTFEAGREFQRQVDYWRPIGLEQGRAACQP